MATQAPPDWAEARDLEPETLKQWAVDRLVENPRFNWVGIYWLHGSQLRLEAWQGPEATQSTTIPIDQGVCGAAARSGQTQNVPDVNADPRYLSCFPTTRSELVVPVKDPDGVVLGEIDIDSDTPGAFPQELVALVEDVARRLGQRLAAADPADASTPPAARA